MKRVFAIVFAFILCVALGTPVVSAAPKVNNTGKSAPARQSSGSSSRNSSSTSSRNSSPSRTSTPSRNTSVASRGTSTASRNASTASKNTSFTNSRPTTTQSRNTTTPTPQRNATPQRTTPQKKVPTTPVRQQTSVKPTPEPMRKVEPLKSAPPLIKKRPVVIRALPHHHRPFVSVSGAVVYIDARSSYAMSPYEIAKILHGDIMIVANPALADFRVDVTDSRAQAHATPRVTERTVPGRGEWRFVTSPPCDYRIYITKNAPDIRVYLLDETGINHVVLE